MCPGIFSIARKSAPFLSNSVAHECRSVRGEGFVTMPASTAYFCTMSRMDWISFWGAGQQLIAFVNTSSCGDRDCRKLAVKEFTRGVHSFKTPQFRLEIQPAGNPLLRKHLPRPAFIAAQQATAFGSDSSHAREPHLLSHARRPFLALRGALANPRMERGFDCALLHCLIPHPFF